ncbi:MFS transporter, partial [Burkholderia contaminans]
METSLDTGSAGAAAAKPSAPPVARTVYPVLGAISFSHMLNDMIQSLILAIYPMLKSQFALSFAQIGLITLTYQITASLLQPLIGLYTDKRPKPYSLPVGMGFTLAGLLLMSAAPPLELLLVPGPPFRCRSPVFPPDSLRRPRRATARQPATAHPVSRGRRTASAPPA